MKDFGNRVDLFARKCSESNPTNSMVRALGGSIGSEVDDAIYHGVCGGTRFYTDLLTVTIERRRGIQRAWP